MCRNVSQYTGKLFAFFFPIIMCAAHCIRFGQHNTAQLNIEICYPDRAMPSPILHKGFHKLINDTSSQSASSGIY